MSVAKNTASINTDKIESLALREEINKRKKKLANFHKHHKKVFDREHELQMAVCESKADLLGKCKHEVHVTLFSPYKGSYSWDYDDGHHGWRMCLICGFRESSKDCSSHEWRILTNPIRRFETYGSGDDNFPYRFPQDHDFQEVLDYVLKHGYTIV